MVKSRKCDPPGSVLHLVVFPNAPIIMRLLTSYSFIYSNTLLQHWAQDDKTICMRHVEMLSTFLLRFRGEVYAFPSVSSVMVISSQFTSCPKRKRPLYGMISPGSSVAISPITICCKVFSKRLWNRAYRSISWRLLRICGAHSTVCPQADSTQSSSYTRARSDPCTTPWTYTPRRNRAINVYLTN